MTFEHLLKYLGANMRSNTYSVDDIALPDGVSEKLHQVTSESLSNNRWSVTTKDVYEYQGRYFAFLYEKPATEIQSGQDNNGMFFEVYPARVLSTVYVSHNKVAELNAKFEKDLANIKKIPFPDYLFESVPSQHVGVMHPVDIDLNPIMEHTCKMELFKDAFNEIYYIRLTYKDIKASRWTKCINNQVFKLMLQKLTGGY